MAQILNNPAFYSAIAAFFSACAAWTLVMIHRSNALDAVRPDLVLAEWSRQMRSNGVEVIHIGKLKNVGKGHALHAVFVTPFKNPPMVGITTERLSLISPGEVKDIGWEVVPMWQQATDGADDKKYLGFTLGVECFDTKEYRHETTYHIMMSNDRTSLVFGAEELGEGIYGYRTSKSKPFWPTRWKGKIRTAVEKGQQFWRKSGKKP